MSSKRDDSVSFSVNKITHLENMKKLHVYLDAVYKPKENMKNHIQEINSEDTIVNSILFI